MSGWANPGLKALMQVAGASGTATTFHAGFILGPRINAGGRIGRADLGARLLSTDDYAEALELAQELDALNVARKDVEREVTEAAVRAVEGANGRAPEDTAVVVAGEGWHPGVIGIVAGRLRERWRKPVVVIGLDPATGLGKGSGRSQPGINLGRAVQAAYDEGLLLAGGGHAMAAGLTVAGGGVDAFRAFLNRRLEAEAADASALDALDIDAVVSARGADRSLLTSFERLAPFGPGNPEPVFALSGVRAEQVMSMRGGHLRCQLVDADGAKLKAVAWRAADTAMGARLLAGGGAIHAAGRLKADDWNGRQGVQLEIEDVADPRRA
jgi:single-stranded-DNA-specific exonuclease